jgi:hypothetical protein
MRTSRIAAICLLSLSAASLAVVADAQTSLKSSDDVRRALATLNRVVGHTQRLMDAKNYERLPHENGEFAEGSEALAKSIQGEPAAFKARVLSLLKTADSDSEALATAAKAHDDAQLATAHAALAQAVKIVIASFPADVQPPP